MINAGGARQQRQRRCKSKKSQSDDNLLYDNASLNSEHELVINNNDNVDNNSGDGVDGDGDSKECSPSTEWNELSLVEFIRESCGVIVLSGRVQQMLTFVIIANAIMMGIATYPIIRNNAYNSYIFDIVDNIFLVIFTVELVLQFVFRGLSMFTDGWLVLDFVVVTVSWAVSQLQIARSLRIFRTLRIMGRIKSMKDIIDSVSSVTNEIFVIFSLILICFYVYAVLFTSMFKHMYRNGLTTDNYFSRLDLTALTLFQIMCNDDWSEIAREVMKTYTWSAYLFILFLAHMSFILLNMFIAIFVRGIFLMGEHNFDEEAPFDEGRAFQEIKLNMDATTQQMRRINKSQKKTTDKIYHLAHRIESHKNNHPTDYI